MKIILLSGGSGKRLWPLSNDARSKQFLKVLKNDTDNFESMVQRVYRQLKNIGLDKEAIISTSSSQIEIIMNQISEDIKYVVEPVRRDTYPAIALAASYLYSVENTSLDEVVIVLPVDSFVEDEFFNRLELLAETLKETDAELALVGVKPTIPTSKYGYIVPKLSIDNSDKDYLRVDYFKEKPDEETAQNLIDNSALWNCGVFAFRLGKIIDNLTACKFPLQYEELQKQYNFLPKISFDYEIVEKLKEIVVLPYNGSWKDLGTWNTLTEEMADNVNGNGILSNSTGTHIVNELDIPIVSIGLENVVVAASPDGILISNKEMSPKIKDIMKTEERPMYEERRWGWYKVVDISKYDEKQVLTRKIYLHEGRSLSYHFHRNRTEFWTVIDGKAEVILDDKLFILRAGDTLKIHPWMRHALKAITNLEIIEIQTSTELDQNDIERICYSWDEIEQICNVINKVLL